MLVPQDVIRRDIIRVHDDIDNPAIKLIEDIARYGTTIRYDVIIEGILGKEKYGSLLRRVSCLFDQTFVFYFDIDFEETLGRHQYKLEKKHEFGEKEMKEWWLEHDVLGVPGELLIPASLTEDETLRLLLKTIAG